MVCLHRDVDLVMNVPEDVFSMMNTMISDCTLHIEICCMKGITQLHVCKALHLTLLLYILGLDAVDQTESQMVFHAGTAMKDSKVVTSGGRVLAVVAMDTSLATAALQAQQGAANVKFEGAYFRSDIAHRALKR